MLKNMEHTGPYGSLKFSKAITTKIMFKKINIELTYVL